MKIFLLEEYMLIRLSKKQTKELEKNLESPCNLLNNSKYDKIYEMFTLQSMILASWIDTQNLTMQHIQKQRTDKMSQLLGTKPNYHVNYEYRNAVWGFQYDEEINNMFIIYESIRGFLLKVNKNFDVNKINNLLEFLISIINKDNMPDYMLKFFNEQEIEIENKYK